MMSSILRTLYMFYFVLSFAHVKTQIPKTIIIPHSVDFIRGGEAIPGTGGLIPEPGDILEFEPGFRGQIKFQSLKGLPNLPITITHSVGQTTTINSTNYTYAVAMADCQYINWDGGRNDVSKSNTELYYGLKLDLQICDILFSADKGSSDISINRMEFNGAPQTVSGGPPGAAISIKSTPECDPNNQTIKFTEETFLLTNLIIKDNLIKNAGLEALYIGFANKKHTIPSGCFIEQIDEIFPIFDPITGQLLQIDRLIKPVQQTVFEFSPHRLDNVRIEDNIILHPGGDGIQVSFSSNMLIKGNVIEEYGHVIIPGREDIYGISIGASSGEIIGNFVGKGVGLGMRLAPIGNLDVLNNFVAETGFFDLSITEEYKFRAGISAYFVDADKNYSAGKNIGGAQKILTIANNLIYKPRVYGIDAQTGSNPSSSANESMDYQIVNNVIIEPQGNSSPSKINLPFINLTPSSPDFIYSEDVLPNVNFYGYELGSIDLLNTSSSNPRLWNITPKPTSPLVNQGELIPQVLLHPDYYGKNRLVNVNPLLISNGNGGLGLDYGPVENYINVLTSIFGGGASSTSAP